MPSKRARQCFADMIGAIALIQEWVREAGGVEQAVYHKTLFRNAIERQLLLLSEAAIRLDKLDAQLGPRLVPSIDWPGIRGIGNFIRHKYDDLDSQIIADVLTGRLEALDTACRSALAILDANA
jgi:uncharacterized protein with HEPN domain